MEQPVKNKYYSPRGHDNILPLQIEVRKADQHLLFCPKEAKERFERSLREAQKYFEMACEKDGKDGAEAYLKAMEISDRAYYYNRATELVGGAVDKAFNRLRIKLGEDLALKIIQNTEIDERGYLKVKQTADSWTKEIFYTIKHDYHELRRMLTIMKVAEYINNKANAYGEFVEKIAEEVGRKHGMSKDEIDKWKNERALPFAVKEFLKRRYKDTL